MPIYDPGWPPEPPYSYPVIVQFAEIFNERSGSARKIKVSSTKRNGSSDYHDFGMAVDFYDSYDNADGSRLMREFARFLWPYRGYFLELIHSTNFEDDNGFYIKNGGEVSAGFYAEPGAHLNHVHLSMSKRAADEVLRKMKSAAPPTPVPPEDPMEEIVATNQEKFDDLVVMSSNDTWRLGDILNLRPLGDPRSNYPGSNNKFVQEFLKVQDEVTTVHQKLNSLIETVNRLAGGEFEPLMYQIQLGDTLTSVAASFNTTVEDLKSKNPLANPDRLIAGQVLRVK